MYSIPTENCLLYDFEVTVVVSLGVKSDLQNAMLIMSASHMHFAWLDYTCR